MKPIKKSITYGRHTLTIETGEIAKQAHGAVMVSMGDTVVLVTAVGDKKTKPGQDFFSTHSGLPGEILFCRTYSRKLL